MPKNIVQYDVFIATPSGLDDIREAFREEIREYNDSSARRRKIVFHPVGWEETLGGKLARPQSFINEELVECDFFVLVLHDRWGSPPDKEKKHTSGCEEEFELAVECFKSDDRPMQRIVAFFRGVDPEKLAAPDTQLKKVLSFKRKLERSREHLYKDFDKVEEFQRWLRRYLARWLYEIEHGAPPAPSTGEPPASPTGEPPASPAGEPETDKQLTEPSPRADVAEAERLASEGRLTEAETIFAKAITGGSDPNAFNRYGHFLRRVGRLAQAEVMYERVLELAVEHGQEWRAIALGGIGRISRSRGDLDKAIAAHGEAIEIQDQHGGQKDLRFMAGEYGQLGWLHQMRGDLERSEELHLKSLQIQDQLRNDKGRASEYGNLGAIYQTRGDLDDAEEMYKKALEIDEEIGNREGVARHTGNLGVIYQKRSDLDAAEEMHKKALEISEEMGSREGVAIQYANLGAVYEERGNLDQACDAFERARDLFDQVGISKWKSWAKERLASLDDAEPAES